MSHSFATENPNNSGAFEKEFNQLYLDSSSKDLLNLEMLAKSISLLPDPQLALVSAYLTTDYFQCTSPDIKPNSEQQWKDSFVECMNKFLGSDIFLLKINMKNHHTKLVVGTSPTYYLSVCNSDEFSIQAEALEMALKKVSKTTNNGNIMYLRYYISLIYILQKKSDPHNDGTLVFIEKDNPPNNSTDLTCVDTKNLFDSFFDRSMLFLAGCVNTLVTIMNLLQKMNEVTPTSSYYIHSMNREKNTSNDPNSRNASDMAYEFRPFIRKDVHEVSVVNQINRANSSSNNSNNNSNNETESNSRDVNMLFNNNNNETLLNESTTDKDSPNLYREETGYNVKTHLRMIEKNVGIFGNDDIYMRFLSTLRGLGVKQTGTESLIDQFNIGEQGNYQNYFKPTTEEEEEGGENEKGEYVEHKSFDETERRNKTLSEEIKKQEKLMKEEREIYCAAIKLSVTSMFGQLSDYVVNCLQRYKRIVSNNNSLRNSARNLFKENIQTRKFQKSNSEELHNNESNNSSNSAKMELKYKGSLVYQEEFNKTKEIRDILHDLMETQGFVPFFYEGSMNEELMSSRTNSLSSRDITIESIDYNVHDKECSEILKQWDMDHFFSIVNLKIHSQENSAMLLLNVPCYNGIPQALLYDEESVLMLLMNMWKSKIKEDSLPFNNVFNSNLPRLYAMVSALWVAKSFVMLSEYEIISEKFDEAILNRTFISSLIPEETASSRDK